MPSVDFKEIESIEFQVTIIAVFCINCNSAYFFELLFISCLFVSMQLNFIKAGGIKLLQSIFVSNNVIMRASTNIMRCEIF